MSSEISSVLSFDSEALVSYRFEEDDGYASRASFDSPTKADVGDSSDCVNLFDNFKMDTESYDPNFCNLLFQNVGQDNQHFNTGMDFKEENVCFDEQWDFLDDPSDIKGKGEPWHSVECLSPEESLPGFSLFADEFFELEDSESAEVSDTPALTCQLAVPECHLSDEASTAQNCIEQPSVNPFSAYKNHQKLSLRSPRVLPNALLRFSGTAASEAMDARDHYPSFVMVTNIGYVGALSCPVTPPVRHSGSISPPHLSSKRDNSSSSTDQKKLLDRAYSRKRHCSALLDHDYLELDVCSNRVKTSSIESQGCNAREPKTSDKLWGKKRRNYKRSKMSRDVTASMTDLSLNTSKDCQYVTLPGRHQSDFVYFAEKKPRMSKRRNSRTFKQ